MLKRFMQDAHILLADAPSSQWDWLFLAQHHGVPTRLLDWSESPLHGLYFASASAAADADDVEPCGALWVLNPAQLNSFSLNNVVDDLPMFDLDDVLDQYAPLQSKGFTPHLKPAAALASRGFFRISAQWGTFTVHTNPMALEDESFDKSVLMKFVIPAEAKKEIRGELQTLGIEERTVYPDLHHLGRSIGERF